MKLSATVKEAMPKSNTRKKKAPKQILALPDLEHAKTAQHGAARDGRRLISGFQLVKIWVRGLIRSASESLILDSGVFGV
jgi:hypothetical protein